MQPKKPVEVVFHCEDCKKAYDFHTKGADGKPFMCRCPYFKWSRFLKKDRCENLELK